MSGESPWLNDMKDQRLEGIKQEGDCEEGDWDVEIESWWEAMEESH
jgi:hypothetical protein